MNEVDNRALRRALAIERISRKMLARRLRGFMRPADYENYLKFVRSEADCEMRHASPGKSVG